MAANMADKSPGLETARPCSEFQSGNTTKQAATELADLAVTKFIGFSGLPAQSRRSVRLSASIRLVIRYAP
jgi:hypothetical protein